MIVAPNAEGTMADVTLLYLVKQVELAIRARLDEAVAPVGLTPLQYTALTVLERSPGLTSAELARNSFVRAQTMAQMTSYLEHEGFLRREPDANSKRQVLLFLTDHGARTVDVLRDSVAQIEADVVDGLSAPEVAAFRGALQAARVSLGGVPAH